jgi:hypothetical protein
MNRARNWSLAAAVALAAVGCGQAHVHSDAANGALGNHEVSHRFRLPRT